MRKYVNFIDKSKYLVIIGITVIVALFSLSLKNLAFEGSYRIWFDKDSKIIEDYESFRNRFSGDDTFIVAFKDEHGIFTKKAVKTVLRLTDAFKNIAGVRKVDSLSNYQYISSEDDDILVEDFLYGDENLSQKKQLALKDNLVLNQLISKDGKTTMIAISLSDKLGSNEAVNIAVFNTLQSLLKIEAEQSGYQFYLTGIPAVTASLVTVSQSDAMVLMPLAVVVVVFFLFYIFRSVPGVVIPSVVIVFTFLAVLGIQMLLGYKLNNFTVNIPSFITAIAVADAMHLYLAWIYYKLNGKKTKVALAEALDSNMLPMAMTSFTTAVGFATLGLSAIEPIATLGIAITSGAVLAFVLTVTIVPAMLLTLGDDYEVVPVKIINLAHIDGYGRFIQRNDKKIVLTFFVLIASVSLGLFKLKVDSNSIKYFSKDTVVRSGAEFVEKSLTGSMRYEIILDSQEKEGVKDPKFLESIVAFEKAFKRHFESVRFTTSLKDIVERMQQVLNPEAKNPLPQDKNLVAQYLLLYSMSLPQGMELNDKMDTQQRYLRLTVNTNIVDTSKDLEMIRWIKHYFKTKTPYRADVQGQTAIFAYMQSSVTDTLIVSISMTLIIVTLSMWMIFNNLKMLWLFLVPNIAPVIIVGGIMGFLGISIDIGVAISAAVILGIAVDDTIHFFSKYYESIKVRSFAQTIDYILSHSGNAMILTTLILSLTFALFGISSFVPNVNFAIVTVAALNIALLFDLVLLPALLSLLSKRRNAPDTGIEPPKA